MSVIWVGENVIGLSSCGVICVVNEERVVTRYVDIQTKASFCIIEW